MGGKSCRTVDNLSQLQADLTTDFKSNYATTMADIAILIRSSLIGSTMFAHKLVFLFLNISKITQSLS